MSICFTLVAIASTWRTAQHPDMDAGTRAAWWRFGLAGVAALAGDILFSLYDLLGDKPFPSLADAAYLLFYPIVLWALLSFPSGRSRRGQLTFWLDISAVMIGGGMFFWHFIFEPTILNAGGDWLLSSLSLIYPIGSLGLLFGVATIRLFRPLHIDPWALRLLVAAMFGYFMADLLYGYLSLRQSYVSGDWVDNLSFISTYLLIISAQVQYRRVRPSASAAQIEPATNQRVNLLPYLGIAAGYGLLLFVASDTWTTSFGALLIGALALTALMIVRQIIALRENLRLLALQALSDRVAREAAEAASRAKSSFLANVSHELRTPLTAIMGYNELLSIEIQHRQYDKLASDIQQIQTASKHLLAMVDNVLDLAKIEAGRMHLEVMEFSLAAMLREVCDSTAPLFMRNNNRFELQGAFEDLVLNTDKVKLQQVLVNVISNAAKFTDHGQITLTVQAELPEQAANRQIAIPFVVFEIADTGIGMTDEQLRQIFQPFVQATKTTTRIYGGTGLGLTISKRFCELMGGTIDVVSTFGVGSVFTIRVPTMAPDESQPDRA